VPAAFRAIVVGTGGFGAQWCTAFLPPFVREGRIDVVAAVDANPLALQHASEGLGVPPSRCYTSAKDAFERHPADFCILVVPPAFREELVRLALAHGMHILSEKPIADTLEASIRIARSVRSAGKKMGVAMSRRYERDKEALRGALRSGAHGALDYLILRHTCDLRKYGSWGAYRHRMPDPLLTESAPHRLDLLADLAGAPCETVYAQTWRPPWAEFAGDCQALVTMTFANGVRALFEGGYANAVELNGFGEEYIRAECERSTVVLHRKRVEAFPHSPERSGPAQEGEGAEIAPPDRERWGHGRVIEQFLDWLEGGEPMETRVDENLKLAALCSAAIESSRTGKPIRVETYFEETDAKVK